MQELVWFSLSSWPFDVVPGTWNAFGCSRGEMVTALTTSARNRNLDQVLPLKCVKTAVPRSWTWLGRERS